VAKVAGKVISCIMAAHNAAGTIAASVRSVLRQTHTELELIIVDDGSTDETRRVLSEFVDPRVVVIHQQQRGASAARNRALAQARGEFVAVIDADDIWRPQKLELQLQALERRADAAVAYGWTDLVDKDLNLLYPDERVSFEGRVFEELLRSNFIWCGSNSLMRRAALDAVGGFDETLEAAEDWELHTRLAARHAFVAVAEVVVWYRQSPHSLSNRLALMEQNYLAANRKVFDAAPPESKPIKPQALRLFYRFLMRRALQSRIPRERWSAARFAALAFWHDPIGLLRTSWQVWLALAILAVGCLSIFYR
jgi:glycosyltransferase involved in cell wall biosynthesis